MKFPRKAATFGLTGSFGRRVVGVAGGKRVVSNVDEIFQKLAEIDRRRRTTSQAFDASRVAGTGHLVHAARSALIAHATKRNLASTLNIELVCWVAAERQIERAFEKVGMRKGSRKLALLTIGASRAEVKSTMTEIFRKLSIERDDTVLKLKRAKFSALQKTFSISQEELKVAPLRKLVLERIALLLIFAKLY